MKILHVNTVDRGGAAKACLRLHNGLLEQGVDSKVLVLSKTNNTVPYVYEYKPYVSEIKKRTLRNRLKRKAQRILKEFRFYKEKQQIEEIIKAKFLNERLSNLEMFSFPSTDIDVTNNELFLEADIIHLHWVAGFLDYQSFFAKCKKPIVWTLHDMNPFSGGEHFNEVFVGIDDNGNPINRTLTLDESIQFDKIIDFKVESLRKINSINVVSLCKWMTDEVKKSRVLGRFPIHTLSNSVSSDVFNQREMKYSRELLNIPSDKTVLLFVADSISNFRKGFEYLLRTFEIVKRKDIILCALGHVSCELQTKDNLIVLGNIYDERLMSIVYSASDVLIIPSLMDNLPNTVLESLMCGTPVIGFPTGGIPDMIQDGENGYLTDEISVSALVDTINKFLEDPFVFNPSKIRENALKKYNPPVQAKNMFNLYSSLMRQDRFEAKSSII